MRLRRFLRGRTRSGRPESLTSPLLPDRSPLRIAVYLSAHGVGHSVRCGAVLDALQQLLPLEASVIAGAGQRRVWPASLAAATACWHEEPTDVGVVQSDDVTVDLAATGAVLETWLGEIPQLVERERRRLEAGFDLVLGDVPALAFRAANLQQIPSVAVANFSWDWIYDELGFPEAAAATSAAYACAGLLLRAAPFAPMAAFPKLLDVGLVARKPAAARGAVREVLGLGEEERVVLLAFQPAMSPSVALPPERAGIRYLAPSGWTSEARRDLQPLANHLPFEDALGAADLVVGKPGYGLIGDVETAGARFLYVPRPGFPENRVLEEHLSKRAGSASLPAAALKSGNWAEELDALLKAAPPQAADAGGAGRAAQEISDFLRTAPGSDARRIDCDPGHD